MVQIPIIARSYFERSLFISGLFKSCLGARLRRSLRFLFADTPSVVILHACWGDLLTPAVYGGASHAKYHLGSRATNFSLSVMTLRRMMTIRCRLCWRRIRASTPTIYSPDYPFYSPLRGCSLITTRLVGETCSTYIYLLFSMVNVIIKFHL